MENKLAKQVALDVALITFGGMLVYAAFQVLTDQGEPISLLFRHSWHTVALGALVYTFLLLRLRTRVLRPLDLLFFHAKDISRGILVPYDYPKTGNEIDQLTEMMNQLVAQLKTMKQTPWKKYADSIERHLDQIREQKTLPPDVHQALMDIEGTLRKMELAIAGFEEAPVQVVHVYGRRQSSFPFLQKGLSRRVPKEKVDHGTTL